MGGVVMHITMDVPEVQINGAKGLLARLEGRHPVKLDNNKFLSLMEANIKRSTENLIRGIEPSDTTVQVPTASGKPELKRTSINSSSTDYIVKVGNKMVFWLEGKMRNLPPENEMISALIPDVIINAQSYNPLMYAISAEESAKELIFIEVDEYVRAIQSLTKFLRKKGMGDRLQEKIARKLEAFDDLVPDRD